MDNLSNQEICNACLLGCKRRGKNCCECFIQWWKCSAICLAIFGFLALIINGAAIGFTIFGFIDNILWMKIIGPMILGTTAVIFTIKGIMALIRYCKRLSAENREQYIENTRL